MKFSMILGLLFLLFSIPTSAREYLGFARVVFVDISGEKYWMAWKFKAEDHQIIKRPIVYQGINKPRYENKYLVQLVVTGHKEDDFEGMLYILEKYYLKGENVYHYKKIMNLDISAKLNFDNEYEITSEVGPMLKVKLNMDKKFTQEEIEKRFSDRSQ